MNRDQLELAREALRRGETNYSRRIVARVLMADPQNERGWLMMAQLVNSREQVIDCLRQVTRINPNNHAAQSALQAMLHGGASLHDRLPPSTTANLPPSKIVLPQKIEVLPEIIETKPVILPLPETAGEAYWSPKRRLNSPLIFGSLIVLLVVIVAVFGPRMAPQDPLEQHFIVQVGETWLRPPFNALQVPGFILGSDQFGRDMFSRILYAVRPTLTLVSIVAVVRLILGTLIGLVAGWSAGRTGRILDGLISAALTVPILLVALGAITVLGTQAGLVAFIVGLSINGWGETARIVFEQTRFIKGQLFIESARSLGASSFHILTRHILRQIMSMVWMLFAFEISSTMMVTAGLGFLGYYIGGDVWITMDDFLAQRTSGAPELGQMLATSWSNLSQSWPLVVTGLAIFIIVLGFNLLGEGLRLRINPEFINRNNPLALLSRRFSMWFEETLSYPVSSWLRVNRLRPAIVTVAVLAVVGSIYLYQAKFANRFNASQVVLTVPGGQIWAADKADPYGTYYINFTGPATPNKLWSIQTASGFSGSPVISKEGTIYLAGVDGTLMAINPEGSILWQVTMITNPIGPLALGPTGEIYVTNAEGSIAAFAPDGTQKWTYKPDAAGKPDHGAIVDSKGNIYYLLDSQSGDTLFALKPDGQLLWSVKPGTVSADTGVRLSSDEKKLYIKNAVVNVQDGSLVNLTFAAQDSSGVADQAHLFVGADGNTYILAGQVITKLVQTPQGYNIVRSVDWNYYSEGLHSTSDLPLAAGVDPEGKFWLYYSGLFGGTSLYWLDLSGNILGSFSSPLTQSNRLVAIDQKSTVYTCGMGFSSLQGPSIMCNAYHKYASSPAWIYTFDTGIDSVIGAAMAPGRLYVITPDGSFTAIGDTSTSPTQPISTP